MYLWVCDIQNTRNQSITLCLHLVETSVIKIFDYEHTIIILCVRASVTVVLLIPPVNRADLFYVVCFCLKFWLHPPPDINPEHNIAFILKTVVLVLESLTLFDLSPTLTLTRVHNNNMHVINLF